MSEPRTPDVPIDQQVVWYASEVAKAKTRLQEQVNGRRMRPDTADYIIKQMRAVLATLRRVEAQELAQ
jgi:cbb3-type cytochrome oxidase cytochrome c subunit